MISRIQDLQQLWQHLGPEWLAYRAAYAAKARTGALRRKMPAVPWDRQPLHEFLINTTSAEPEAYLGYRRTEAPPFFFSSSQRAEYQPYFSAWDNEASPVDFAERLAEGKQRYFGGTVAQTGFPPDWHANPFTGEKARADIHWTEIQDFENGDIKVIWEPSRFGFVYDLVRAYWRTSDERYVETFWHLVQDWRVQNQPQLGPNWKCGQEISFRIMAWCFGLYGFLASESSSAERVATLAQMIAVSASRIAANLDFALSLRNNHGISEGLGLWTVGALFPEFRQAKQWVATGRQVLEDLGRELIYDDGAFSQHSSNYHRLMLHDYLWTLRLGDLLDRPFTSELKDRVSKAGEFLFQIQDTASGRVPNYGQNDSALVLPLNNCDYRDFRPVIQATHYYANGSRCVDFGPWDEDLLWLFGPEAMRADAVVTQRKDFKAEQGGCYTLRSADGFTFVRCARFRHRPSQADELHVDLWWRGQNIATDAGTFSYNSAPPWNNPFAHTACHNTVTVDDKNQMELFSRFLWLPWVKGGVRSHVRSAADHLAYWEGEHDGYLRLNRPALHRRAIVRMGEHWLVLDSLTSDTAHDYRLQWLLMDAPYDWNEKNMQMTLTTVAGSYFVQLGAIATDSSYSIMRANESAPRGWRAPHYNALEPALSLGLEARASAVRFWTLLGPESCEISASESLVELQTGTWQASINFDDSNHPNKTLIASVRASGAITDQLRIT